MQELEKMKTWLRTCPMWQESWELHMDFLEGGCRNGGLYPEGMEVTGTHEDILGNTLLDCRYRFTLRFLTGNDQEAAQQLLDFQNWVQAESFRGTCPHFGDGQESIRAEHGCKDKSPRPGTCLYQVGLTAQFQKFYEVTENGKN